MSSSTSLRLSGMASQTFSFSISQNSRTIRRNLLSISSIRPMGICSMALSRLPWRLFSKKGIMNRVMFDDGIPGVSEGGGSLRSEDNVGFSGHVGSVRSQPRWCRPRWSRPRWSRPLPFTGACTYSALLSLFFFVFTSINISRFQRVMSPQSPPAAYHRYLHTRRAYRPKYHVLLTATYRSLRITLSRFREVVKPHCETSILTCNYLPQTLLRRIPIRNLDRLGAIVTKS
jgi:hypothetical protein